MGKVDFDDDVWLGIDLKKKNCNGNNGEAGGRKYFEPKEKCGYFIKMNEIERILPSKSQKAKKKKKKKKKRKCLKNFPKLGDRVKTVNGRVGIVEFIGVICLVKDICIGLTLDKQWEHGNDGSVKGKRYFTCEKGRGYFVRLQHLVENLGSTLGQDGITNNKLASNIDPEATISMQPQLLLPQQENDANDIKPEKEEINAENIKLTGNVQVMVNTADVNEIAENKNDDRASWERREDFEFKSEQLESGYYRIREKLKEIEMLEERHRCGFFLFPTQFKKVARKKEFLDTIEQIKNGTWIPPPVIKKPKNSGNAENEAMLGLLDCDQDSLNEDDDGDIFDDNDIDNNKDIIDDPFGDLDDCLYDMGYQVVGTGLNGNVAPPTLNGQEVINAQLQITNTNLNKLNNTDINNNNNNNDK